MKINKKALELIEKGLSSKTVSKLDESQINTLHKKLFLGEQVTEVPGKKTYKVALFPYTTLFRSRKSVV